MNAHTKPEAIDSSIVPRAVVQTLDMECWSLHHEAHILVTLIEDMQKNLMALKKIVGYDFTASAQVSHVLHQAYQVTGTADKLREEVDKMV